MKDFDDFHGLDDEELTDVLNAAAKSVGIEGDGDNYRIPFDKLLYFASVFSYQITNKTLRKYHEWLQSDGNPTGDGL